MVKILEQARDLKPNEIIFRRHTNLNPSSTSVKEVLELIEQHSNVTFEWIPENELVDSTGELIGLRIIKKDGFDDVF